MFSLRLKGELCQLDVTTAASQKYIITVSPSQRREQTGSTQPLPEPLSSSGTGMDKTEGNPNTTVCLPQHHLHSVMRPNLVFYATSLVVVHLEYCHSPQ